ERFGSIWRSDDSIGWSQVFIGRRLVVRWLL
ncbi:MAG: hypothetical protein ACI9OJ_002881, partial [Myxococcota bacterium]